MKDFHRSFICRSTETGEKKGHKSKHNSNKNEICKCYAPFLKLHYYDCPVAKKSCPIHGNPYRHCVKDEKTEKKENMVISFHPSSKTDKLFRPVKNLLAHCNPETKINLEYYALNNSVTKDGVKNRQVQTNPEEFKKSLGSNVFVEKTKSFVTEKTNKMKRLKQCFHSPCNSIMARTRSEITIKNKIKENFCEIAKHAAVATNLPEEPSDVFLYEKSKWTSSNKLDLSDWEKSSEQKVESDFLTVTKQVENKMIDHKIFEIKHKKGFGDIRSTKPPKQSPLVYSSYNIQKPKNTNVDFNIQVERSPNPKSLEKYPKDNELMKKKIEEEEISSSDKSQSSSSGSIYFTPAILIPPGVENDTSDESKYTFDIPNEGLKNRDEERIAKDSEENSKTVHTQTSVLGKTIYETTSTSEDSAETRSFESERERFSLKQHKDLGSANSLSSDKFITTPGKSDSLTSNISRKKSCLSKYISLTSNKPVDKSIQTSFSRCPDLFDDELNNKKEKRRQTEVITVLEESREHSPSETRERLSSETREHLPAETRERLPAETRERLPAETRERLPAETRERLPAETRERLPAETRERMPGDTRKSSQVQTDIIQKREISLLYDGIRNVVDKLTQTEPVITKNVQVETMVAKKNKSEMTYWTAVKSIQTSFTLSDSQSQSQEEEFADVEPHVKYATASFTRPDSNQKGEKSPWKKSLSDGELCIEQKSNAENENLISIHHICLCENSETSTSDSDYNSYVKISRPEESDTRPIVQNQNRRRPSPIKKDTISKGEQTSLSDLSELARMVDQFFDKMSREAFKSCECEKMRDSKINQRIQADFSKSLKKPAKNMVDSEVQTTFKIKLDVPPEEDKAKDSLKKIHQSVIPQDDGEKIFVCKICRRKVNTIDDSDSLEKTTSKKEVTFRSVGTSTDGFVEKRSIGVCVPDYPTVKCFGKKRPLPMSQCVSTSEMYNASAAKAPLCETRSFFLTNSTKETTKDCSVNITTKEYYIASGQSTSEPKSDLQQTPVQKKPVTINQAKEKKNVKISQTSDDWKFATNFSLRSETFETRTISKPSDASKAKPETRKFKSGIPTATSFNRKNINFKDNESDECNLNTQVIFTQCTNKPIFNSQKDSCTPGVSYNRNTICICDYTDISDDKLSKLKSRTEPSTSNEISKASHQKPPLPKKPQPGESSNRRKSMTPTSVCPEKPSNEKKFIFPAIIRPMWYKDFRKTLQMIKNSQALHESKSNILKQKRLWEDDDLPGGKKIKGRDNGSGESYEFEQSVVTSSQIINVKESTGFVWVPSSAQQLPKADTRSRSFVKGSQSESKLGRSCLQNSSLIKGFNKRSANVSPVKSCRLKPVQVNEKHPFRKLFECRLCKSLNFLKTDQKNSLKNEQPSEGSFGCKSLRGRDEVLVPHDENCEPENWVLATQADEEFVVGYSFSSGSSNADDLTEISNFVDDECETKNEETEPSLLNHYGAQVDALSHMPQGSQSFDLFWFGSDAKKK